MATELIWVFDHPFRPEEWPLEGSLQEAMLDVVVKNAVIPDDHILRMAKLTYAGSEEGVPGHPELNKEDWCMPGVVMYPRDEEPEKGYPESNFVPQVEP